MREERWGRPANPGEPRLGALWLAAHSLELTTCPPDDVGIDSRQGRTQLRLVEAAIVEDPTSDARNCTSGPNRPGICRCDVAASSRGCRDQCASTPWGWQRDRT